MPKLIDHAQRDREIADAAMRVLARDGLANLSVRKVADEAGLATASLRRAFPTQHALRRFCLDRIEQAVTARIRSLEGDGMSLALAALCELLPLDEQRRIELTAQLQLGTLAFTDPELSEPMRRFSAGVRRVCVAALDELGLVGRALEAEAERLHALLDGLALRILWSGADPGSDAAESEATVALLERHLRSLID